MAAPDAGGPINALTASQNVLDCFWNLAAPEEEKRLAAAESLVKELLARQQEHADSHPATADSQAPLAPESAKLPKAKQQELALRRCSPLMVYALRRLARGLGSGRAGARQGFATALAMLLGAQVHGPSESGGSPVPLFVDASDVLVLLETCLEASGTMKASDAREALVGRLFGYGALVQSGLLSRAPGSLQDAKTPTAKAGGKGSKGTKTGATAAAGDAPPADLAACVGCAKALLDLGKSRSFLQEAATATLLQLVGRLGPAGAGQLLEQSSQLRDALSVKVADASPEALLLALSLWPVMSPQLLASCSLLPKGCPQPSAAVFFPPDSRSQQSHTSQQQLQGGWFDFLAQQQPGYEAPSTACCDALFNAAYLESLLPVLQATISSNPRLHLLWRTLLALLLPSARARSSPSAPSTPNLAHVEALWSTVVERGLLVGSHEKKFLSFRLFQALLPHLGPDHVPVVFSKGFSRVLLNNLRNKDNYLHAAATRCMDVVSAFAGGADGGGTNGATRLAVAAVLQQLNIRGVAGVDAKAAAGAAAKASVKKALPSLDTAGVSAYIAHMRSSFVSASKASDAGEGEDAAEAATQVASQRSHAIEQMCSVLRTRETAPEDVEKVLRFLATHAFLDVPVGSAAADTPAPGPASAKKGKKGAAKAATASAEPEVAEAAGLAAPVSPLTRRLCAHRLIAALEMLAPHKQRDAKAQGAGQAQGQQQAPLDGPAVMSRLVAYLHKFAQDSGTAGAPQLATPLEGERDVALTMLREVEQALVALTAAGGKGGKGGASPDRTPAVRALLHLVRMLQVCVLADADEPGAGGDDDGEGGVARGSVDPELALGLRRVAREGLGAPLEELATQAEEEDDEDEEGEEGSEGKADEAQAMWQDVLVDVLLSLLSRPASAAPTAGLRDAVEALWRSMAYSLTPSGMADLVRVVVGGGEAGDVLEGEEEESDEEEVELEVGSDSDEEEEEEEEEEGEGKGKAKGKQQKGAAKGKAKGKGGESDDEEEEEEEGGSDAGSDKESDEDGEGADDDEPDDAEMFAMDDRMAAYLRRMVDARNSAKDRRQALANLRLRALVLIQTHAAKVPNSPLMLTALVPLIKALISARRSMPNPDRPTDLIIRLEAVLRAAHASKRSTPAPSALPFSDEELAAAMRSALGVASRMRDRVAAQAAANAWTALLKHAVVATAPAGAAEAAAESFRAGLTLALTKKSRLHLATLQDLAQAAPSVVLPSLPDLLQLCTSAPKALQQAEAQQLLAHLFKPALQVLERRLAKRRKEAKLKLKQQGSDGTDPSASSAPADALPVAVEGEAEEELGEENEALAAALQQQRQALSAALVSAVSGAGMKKEHHAAAVKSAAMVVEGLRVLFPKKRLPEIVGPDTITSIAKAVATVQDIGASPKVAAQLRRLIIATSLQDLLEKTKPDPALKAKLLKAQAKAQPAAGGAAAAKGAAAKAKPEPAIAKPAKGAAKEAAKGAAKEAAKGATKGADKGADKPVATKESNQDKKRPGPGQQVQAGPGKKAKVAAEGASAPEAKAGVPAPKKRPTEQQQSQKKKAKAAQ